MPEIKLLKFFFMLNLMNKKTATSPPPPPFQQWTGRVCQSSEDNILLDQMLLLIFKTNSPCQPLWKYIENSIENIHFAGLTSELYAGEQAYYWQSSGYRIYLMLHGNTKRISQKFKHYASITIFICLNGPAFIKFFVIWVLFSYKGSVYMRVAFS